MTSGLNRLRIKSVQQQEKMLKMRSVIEKLERPKQGRIQDERYLRSR